MIFVALGTQKFQLNRLLKEIDRLIENGGINELVFAQIGNSDYKPVNYEYMEFTDKEKFDEMVGACDLLITHSGVGTIISGLNQDKPIIVFPRLAQYGEHVDDHQLEIAKSFSDMNYVLICDKSEDLGRLIEESKTHKFDKYISHRQSVIDEIEGFLNSF